MRCFYHQDREAVGTCKSCGKGLCPECAVDLGKGLACRGRCEADVAAVIQLVEQNVGFMDDTKRIMERNKSVLKHTSSTHYLNGLFLTFTGAIFTFIGLADMDRLKSVFALGVAFLVFGVFWILHARRFPRDKRPPKENPEG